MDSPPKTIPGNIAVETAGESAATQPRSWLLALLRFGARLPIMRFFLVSSISTIVDYVVLYLLTVRLPHTSMFTLLAVAAGYLVGTIVNFVLARHIVFRPSAMRTYNEFLLVAIVAGIGLGLTVLITLVLKDNYGWPVLLAKTAAIVIVFFWNFLARRYLIYRHPRPLRDNPTRQQVE